MCANHNALTLVSAAPAEVFPTRKSKSQGSSTDKDMIDIEAAYPRSARTPCGAHIVSRLATSRGVTNRSNVRWSVSRRMRSPVSTTANGPRSAASGVMCRTTVPYAYVHPRVAGADHVLHPSPNNPFWSREPTPRGHARTTLRASTFRTRMSSSRISSVGSFRRCCMSSTSVNITARPVWCSSPADAVATRSTAPPGAAYPGGWQDPRAR